MRNEFSIQQIKDLEDLISSLSNDEFTHLKDAIFGSSIGKHIRHIIAFYQSFFDSTSQNQVVCYDDRKRIETLETDVNAALIELQKIRQNLENHIPNQDLILKTSINNEFIETPTNVVRELIYLNEHTTHHIAIIRLILAQSNIQSNHFKNLGMAYSTPK